MVFPDVLAGVGGDADAVHDGAVVPGLAHAETVHGADPHVGHHLRRRHGDQLGARQWIDAGGRQPVVHPHGMGAGGESAREGVLTLFLGHQLGQRGAVDRSLVRQRFGQGNRLSVVVDAHQHGHVLLRTGRAQVHAVDQPVQHVGHVQLAADQLVAHPGPAGFLGGDDRDAVFLVETQHRGHHDAGAVGQRDEADLHFLLFRGVRTLGIDGGAQCGVDADGPDGGGLQHGAPAEAGFQKISHGKTP